MDMKTKLSLLLTVVGIVAIATVIPFRSVKGEVKQDAQKFKVTYTVTYNAVTLAKAAELEEKIKKENKDGCNVKVKVSPVTVSTVGTITFSNSLFTPTNP